LRVEVSVAVSRLGDPWYAAAGWAQRFVLIFEAWHGLGHRAARLCERVVEGSEGVWACWRIAVFPQRIVARLLWFSSRWRLAL
jgi:hypothetical protein